ncbi:hypothetical protein B0J13DRAFT_16584 [Dactylonectria estremocensis]|uniref:Uncharacterized protein n=1 Tax=Dactylonectria estremocensis TaxID=1079267 RepID=A0A9P9JID2_9HYPO|nr:hypothetical protein B0J13DRAFT_16584 [Dactylonectria estremocensis]
MLGVRFFAICIASAGVMALPHDKQTNTTPPTQATTTLSSIMASTHSIDCDYAYCDGSISWCFYFVPFTTFNISLGPLPGERRTSLGPCEVKTIEATTTVPAYEQLMGGA